MDAVGKATPSPLGEIMKEPAEHRTLHGKLLIRHEWTLCRVVENFDEPLQTRYVMLGRYPSEQAAEAACRELLALEMIEEEEDEL